MSNYTPTEQEIEAACSALMTRRVLYPDTKEWSKTIDHDEYVRILYGIVAETVLIAAAKVRNKPDGIYQTADQDDRQRVKEAISTMCPSEQVNEDV